MSVSLFANAFRTQSRLRVLTATHAALPATRSIGSLFTRIVPENVSLSASRSVPTSQVARNELEDASRAATPSDTISAANNKLAINVASRERPTTSSVNSNTLFVRNINWYATRELITKVFSQFGEVTKVEMYMHQNRFWGCAHIHFASRSGVVATMTSIAQKPLYLGGRDMRIDTVALYVHSRRNELRYKQQEIKSSITTPSTKETPAAPAVAEKAGPSLSSWPQPKPNEPQMDSELDEILSYPEITKSLKKADEVPAARVWPTVVTTPAAGPSTPSALSNPSLTLTPEVSNHFEFQRLQRQYRASQEDLRAAHEALRRSNECHAADNTSYQRELDHVRRELEAARRKLSGSGRK